MRLLLISLGLALLLCLPYIALYHGADYPFSGAFMLPVTALHFAANFIHESGHAVMRWLFGYPALPALDFDHGGGVTTYGARSPLLLGAVWAGFIAGIVLLTRRKHYRRMIALAGALVILVSVSFHPLHEVLILYAGHGAEVTAALGLVVLAHRKRAILQAFWRGTMITAGMYVVLKNAMTCLALVFSKALQFGYGKMKGGSGFGDYSRIADLTGAGIAASAAFMLLLTLACVVCVVNFIRKHP